MHNYFYSVTLLNWKKGIYVNIYIYTHTYIHNYSQCSFFMYFTFVNSPTH